MEDISVNNSVLTVNSIFHNYKVNFDLKNSFINKKLRENTFFVIIDKKVEKLYANQLRWMDDAKEIIKIEAIEKNKDINKVKSVSKNLLQNGINKNDVIVVIGGGIIQDVSAFTANIIKRGVKWYFIPTTLLAMCDSCIGSKVGINMSGFKNQLGVFWPPSEIFIDINFLRTLNKKEIVSGIGEIIKVHLISGNTDFSNLEKGYDNFIDNYENLNPFIFKSLEIKKKIVEKDEFDLHHRHILNYGHTFGHAIEAYTNNTIPHGIAVSIGMNIANYVSLNKGYISHKEYDRMESTIKKNIIYDSLDFSDLNKMGDLLKTDKKYDGSFLKVILTKGIGKIIIDRINVDKSLLGLINDYADKFNSA